MSPLESAVISATDLAPRTKELYLVCVREFLEYAPEPKAWTVGMVEDWLGYLMSESRPKGRLAPQTVRVYRKAIRYASRRYAKRERQEDFAHLVDRIKANKPERDEVLDEDELGKLLRTCGDRSDTIDLRDYTLIVVAARTGLRRGGLHAMTWEGVDFKTGEITTKQKGGGTITLEADKLTLQTLKEWKEAFTGERFGRPTGSVWRYITARGETSSLTMSEWQIWDVFRKRSKRAKIRHVHPHLMRHSTVTWLRDAGVSSMDVRRLTGQTEKTIEDIYTHSRKKGAVADVLGDLPGRRKK